jgi:hypothetical protein
VRSEEEARIEWPGRQIVVPANRAPTLARWASGRGGIAAAEVLPTYVGAVHARPNRRGVLVSGESK